MIALLANSVWFLAVAVLLGWALQPRRRIPGSAIATWTVWLALGMAAMVFASIVLIKLNIPGKQVRLLPMLLVPLQVAFQYLRGRTLPRPTFNTSLSGFALISALMALFFYYPFLARNTGGFYAVSGGDHSIYLRTAEYYLQHGFDEPVPERDVYLPPYPNWNIRTGIRSMQLGETGAIFAANLTSVPAMAVCFTPVESSYTISLYASLVLLVFATASLLGFLLEISEGAVIAAAAAAAFSNLILWSAARHSAPALFASGLAPALVLIICSGLRELRIPILGSGLLTSSLMLIYLPMLLARVPFQVGLFGLLQLAFRRITPDRRAVLRIFRDLTAIGLLVIAVIHFSDSTMLRRMLSLVSFQSADFGLEGWHAFPTLSGVFDFDLLFPSGASVLRPSRLHYGWVTSGIVLLLSFVPLIRARAWSVITVAVPLLTLDFLAYWHLKHAGMQYSGIRFAEMASIQIIGLAGIALWQASSRWPRLAGRVALTGIVLSALFVPLKATFYWRVLGSVRHEHSDFVGIDAVDMVAGLKARQAQIESAHPGQGIIYWFGSGPVTFSGSEILFRTVRYFEAYNYDYDSYIGTHSWWRGVHVDILAPQHIHNSLFVLPTSLRADIIRDHASFRTPPTNAIRGYDLYDTTQGSGVALVGDAWNAPLYSGAETARYLKGRPAGLVFWSATPRSLDLELQVMATAKDQKIDLVRDGSDRRVRFELRPKPHFIRLTVNLDAGMNVFRLVPEGPSTVETWGLIQRPVRPWVAFLGLSLEPRDPQKRLPSL